MKKFRVIGAFAAIAILFVACDAEPPKVGDGAQYPDPFEYRFAGYDTDCGGIPGYVDPNHYGYELTPQQQRGACTWYLWVGGDPLSKTQPADNARGNPRFFRHAEALSWKASKITGADLNFNFLDYLDSRNRAIRFKEFGAINDPGCKQASQPDAYGLWLDECEDPYSSGVMGIRIFPNPNFDPKKWDAETFLKKDARIEPPYVSGLTCGVCHIGFNPVYPPEDPANPKWENLAGALGNQYLREGALFGAGYEEDEFRYWVTKLQPAGTSDTSRTSTDFIDNPNAINAVFLIDSARPTYDEVMNDGISRPVPHILKDGSDSIGAAAAALRVYVNIGTCGDYRMGLEQTFIGFKPQTPFDLHKAEAECEDWRLTSARMEDAAAFLDSPPPYLLVNALSYADENVKEKYQPDDSKLALGKKVFGTNCARCHSSKLPEGYTHDGNEKHAESAADDWVALVMQDDFLDKNFLSDDRRYPLYSDDASIAIGTNAARAMGTNAIEGHLWQNFSSKTYKQLPSLGTASLYNPFDPDDPIEFEFPAGGLGYYRTPSLISIWATAPFLLNNSVGLYNHDPSVKGRMDAFMDASEKLLWPEKRLGPESIKVTPIDTVLRFRSHEIRVPAGTPIKLLANINLRDFDKKEGIAGIKKLLADPKLLIRVVKALKGNEAFDEELKRLVPGLLKHNQIPDFIEDKGHTAVICRSASDEKISCISNDEKWALIEYIKTF